MTTVGKEFVLANVFKNVSSMKDKVAHFSRIEEHFGVPWKINLKRDGDHLALYLHCLQEKKEDNEWSIETWSDTKLKAVNEKLYSKSGKDIFKSSEASWGWPEFIKWEDLIKDYVLDDTLTVEFRVKIKKMTGIEMKTNLISFDESTKEFSDVVLVVENQKFHVLKLFLARNSSYFNSLLMGNFEESGKSEVTLGDVQAEEFQNFLELVYGETPIDKFTIDGILHLSDMYDVTLAIRKCEQFLMDNSKKSLKQKLQLAHRYNLTNLKNSCLSKITTAADIRSVLIDDLSEMDLSVVGALMQKSLALNEK